MTGNTKENLASKAQIARRFNLNTLVVLALTDLYELIFF